MCVKHLFQPDPILFDSTKTVVSTKAPSIEGSHRFTVQGKHVRVDVIHKGALQSECQTKSVADSILLQAAVAAAKRKGIHDITNPDVSLHHTFGMVRNVVNNANPGFYQVHLQLFPSGMHWMLKCLIFVAL